MSVWTDLVIAVSGLVVYLLIALCIVFPFLITSAVKTYAALTERTAAELKLRRVLAEAEEIPFALFWPVLLIVEGSSALYRWGKGRSVLTEAEGKAAFRELEAEDERARADQKREDDAADLRREEEIQSGLHEESRTHRSFRCWNCHRYFTRENFNEHIKRCRSVLGL
jgi:hypothetical protein